MARITGSNGERTAAAIRQAALRLIHQQGFAAMNLRELAAAVGISPASLYNHMTTKQSLLFDLMLEHMTALLEQTDAALAAAGPEPLARLEAFGKFIESKDDADLSRYQHRKKPCDGYSQ